MDRLGTLCFFGLLLMRTALAADWGYIGATSAEFWKNSAPDCALNSQSPINIFQGDVASNGIGESLFTSNYYTTVGLDMALSNNGHGAVISLGGDTQLEISGAGLGSVFRVAQFHFHWGVTEKEGSEHLINNMAYPMELHIVHYNTKYASLGAAADKADGLAVLGFMFEVSASENTNYRPIVNNLKSVVNKGDSVAIEAVSMDSLLPDKYSNFYRYSGSLTTPPCYQSVTWTVFTETIKISENQLDMFRTIRDNIGDNLLFNYRPVQPLNGRQVSSSFDSQIEWSYEHGDVTADQWPHYYEACSKVDQSPINIPVTAAQVDSNLGSFTFNNYNTTAGVVMTMKNTGHTVKVDVKGGDMSVQNGGLPEKYSVAQFHLHWGASSMMGSEHTMDSKKYPMELHIVHYKTSLGDLGTAAVTPEGLAVLGIFFEVAGADNPNLDPFINKLEFISAPYSNVTVDPFTLSSLIPAKADEYYRYSGSLTTPGCYETVHWTVFYNPITVSETQMAKLRALLSSDKDQVTKAYYPMVNNFRPVQNLNTRPIFRSFTPTLSTPVKWTYIGSKGPAYWSQNYNLCEDTPTSRQSPIDIDPHTVTYDNSFAEFTFNGFDTTSGVAMAISNNGHSVVVSYTAGHPTVSGGGLSGTYKVAQFHLHWGSTDTVGSEHTIEGASYPMELHIVTYNTVYADIGLALTQANGLAVLGFMIKVGSTDNSNWAGIISKLPSVTQPDTESQISAPFTLASLLPAKKSSFYRYDGSLTTPGCEESVTWTLFRDAISLSSEQLAEFRKLKSSDLDSEGQKTVMVNNFRPPQPLNNRVIRANFFIGAGQQVTPGVTMTTVLALLVLMVTRATKF